MDPPVTLRIQWKAAGAARFIDQMVPRARIRGASALLEDMLAAGPAPGTQTVTLTLECESEAAAYAFATFWRMVAMDDPEDDLERAWPWGLQPLHEDGQVLPPPFLASEDSLALFHALEMYDVQLGKDAFKRRLLIALCHGWVDPKQVFGGFRHHPYIGDTVADALTLVTQTRGDDGCTVPAWMLLRAVRGQPYFVIFERIEEGPTFESAYVVGCLAELRRLPADGSQDPPAQRSMMRTLRESASYWAKTDDDYIVVEVPDGGGLYPGACVCFEAGVPTLHEYNDELEDAGEDDDYDMDDGGYAEVQLVRGMEPGLQAWLQRNSLVHHTVHGRADLIVDSQGHVLFASSAVSEIVDEAMLAHGTIEASGE